jgi:hypothetical protein
MRGISEEGIEKRSDGIERRSDGARLDLHEIHVLRVPGRGSEEKFMQGSPSPECQAPAEHWMREDLEHDAADEKILLDLVVQNPRRARAPRTYVGRRDHPSSSIVALTISFQRGSFGNPRLGFSGSSGAYRGLRSCT